MRYPILIYNYQQSCLLSLPQTEILYRLRKKANRKSYPLKEKRWSSQLDLHVHLLVDPQSRVPIALKMMKTQYDINSIKDYSYRVLGMVQMGIL